MGEPVIPNATIFVDLNRNNTLDAGEPSTLTLDDGTYTFTGLATGTYVIREVVSSGYSQTSPTTVGGILWPIGTSNPAVGNVTPTSITTSLAQGQVYRTNVSITLPNTGALTNLVDVFLLFDDTGSFVNNSPIVRAAFPDIITRLNASLPGINLGFGVGRLKEYANFASEYSSGRPFILNQPIVAASTAGYLTSIQAALNRTAPGYGGDQPETDIEALFQVVTGKGFDGNNRTATTIANGTTDPIAPGDPFYFQIASGFGTSVANGVVSAIQNAVTNVAVDIEVRASDPRVHLTSVPGVRMGIGSGMTSAFDIEIVGDGAPRRFDLQFVRAGTNVVLGSIPVVLGTPIEGDGYHYDELEDGEIEIEDDFGDHGVDTGLTNLVPSFAKGSDKLELEDSGLNQYVGWATAISPGGPLPTKPTMDCWIRMSQQ